MTSKEKAAELLKEAGITINGPHPYDMQVHNEHLYNRVLSGGNLAFGEAYMDGWWDVADMEDFFYRLINAKLDRRIRPITMLWPVLKAYVLNMQSKERAKVVGERHYDVGNDLYERMLDKRMVYTCGYWSSPAMPAKDLDEAQEQKLDLVCRKIGLTPGMTVLDIGCGWGSFAKFATERYGAKVTGITISKEQAALARERCRGLDVEIRFEDYRDTVGQFDRIVSLGMFEHVGTKNYRTYFEKARGLLKDEGIFLLHSIGYNESHNQSDAWIDKYIFPGGVLPSITQIGRAMEGLFVMEDWHNFGPDYNKTLRAWAHNFESHWSEIKDRYSERFYRMWRFYLYASAGLFRARMGQLWQIVLTKDGLREGYKTVR